MMEIQREQNLETDDSDQSSFGGANNNSSSNNRITTLLTDKTPLPLTQRQQLSKSTHLQPRPKNNNLLDDGD